MAAGWGPEAEVMSLLVEGSWARAAAFWFLADARCARPDAPLWLGRLERGSSLPMRVPCATPEYVEPGSVVGR